MKFRTSFILRLWLVLASAAPALAQDYDPLAVDTNVPPVITDLTVHDATRNRDLPIRVYLPSNPAPAPVVLFSHGLGGSREGSAFLGRHWAARGYVAVFLQHPGSDDSLWQGKPMPDARADMARAVSVQNFLLRVQDVPAVLDQLAVWNTETNHPLAGRMNLKKVGMSGHSFGANTTQAVSGQTFPQGGQRYTDSRIAAAIAFSPSSPKLGSAAKAFAAVHIPWMLMTGTKDTSPLGTMDVASRLAVYNHLQGAPKYEVVLNNAEHSVFTDRALPGDQEPRNPNHHRVILALSTAFWDAYLKNDPAALAWLQGPGPRSVMEAGDQWRFEAP